MEVIEERISPKPQIVRQPLMKSSGRRLSSDSVRLHRLYYAPWLLAIVTPVLTVLYDWLQVEPECWDNHCKHWTLITSIVVSVFTTLIALILCVVYCAITNDRSISRIRASAITFVLLATVSIINLLLALLMFMQKTCYFTQVVPSERLDNADWLTDLSVRYDIKLAGVHHLLTAVFGFLVAMGFAIIKNNYKYIKQIDFDYE